MEVYTLSEYKQEAVKISLHLLRLTGDFAPSERDLPRLVTSQLATWLILGLFGFICGIAIPGDGTIARMAIWFSPVIAVLLWIVVFVEARYWVRRARRLAASPPLELSQKRL